jgi:hypothetical protein
MALTTDELLDLPVLVPMKVVAQALDLNYRNALQAISIGRFPLETVKVNRTTYVKKIDLLRFLEVTPPADDV